MKQIGGENSELNKLNQQLHIINDLKKPPIGRPPDDKHWDPIKGTYVDTDVSVFQINLNPQPVGRPPIDKLWNPIDGIYIDLNLNKKPTIKNKRPRGRAPKNRIWNMEKQEWSVIDKELSEINAKIKAEKLEKRKIKKENKTKKKIKNNDNRPKGRAPKNRIWNVERQEWSVLDKELSLNNVIKRKLKKFQDIENKKTKKNMEKNNNLKNRPKGRTPKNRQWNEERQEWSIIDKELSLKNVLEKKLKEIKKKKKKKNKKKKK